MAPFPTGLGWCQHTQRRKGRGRMKSAEEIMNVLEAYDLTGSYRDAAELAGCSHHTVAHYVALRAAGKLTAGQGARRPLARSDPGGRGAPETGRDGLHRLRADHPPGRGRLEGRLAGRPSAGGPLAGPPAGPVGPVRLRRRAPGGRHARRPSSYTHLRAHETRHDLVCRLLLEKKKTR